ncbi:hypothetical protein [Lacticigenium naphthae]|uniref:hypothetical protein n=1 Tax=Lacticigenium naphthae TaxID=515351 RepID=UPI00041D56FF|nr:hypothetical protein [Lacticigenium naphthae]
MRANRSSLPEVGGEVARTELNPASSVTISLKVAQSIPLSGKLKEQLERKLPDRRGIQKG